MSQNLGQLGKETVNFVAGSRLTTKTKTFVGNLVGASSAGHHVCNVGASDFLRHSPCSNLTPEQFDLLTVAQGQLHRPGSICSR